MVRIWTGTTTYFPGEAPPHDLPATAYGLDVQWGHGPWNVYGELSHFQMTYKTIPDFNMHTGYAEARRVLTPRWYAAARAELYAPAEANRARKPMKWPLVFAHRESGA